MSRQKKVVWCYDLATECVHYWLIKICGGIINKETKVEDSCDSG